MCIRDRNIANAIESVSTISTETSSALINVSNTFYNDGAPALNTIGNSLKGGLDTANSVLELSLIHIYI